MELTLYGVSLWAGALLFVRIGTLVMLLPGLGEASVPPRARLGLAIMLTALLAPLLQGAVPPPPDDPFAMTGIVVSELFVGLMFGACARLLMTGLATAGQIMGLETGLSFAQTADPTMSQTGQLFAVFLGVFGIALVFATDLHHAFLRGIVGTYSILAPGAAASPGDAAQLAVDVTAQSFRVGLQVAAPVIVGGLIFRVGLGVLARLIPTIQVFFVALPLQILGGFFLIALGLSAGMIVWLDSLQQYASRLGG
jgi:flagellar biosynthetic protein FliR